MEPAGWPRSYTAFKDKLISLSAIPGILEQANIVQDDAPIVLYPLIEPKREVLLDLLFAGLPMYQV